MTVESQTVPTPQQKQKMTLRSWQNGQEWAVPTRGDVSSKQVQEMPFSECCHLPLGTLSLSQLVSADSAQPLADFLADSLNPLLRHCLALVI